MAALVSGRQAGAASESGMKLLPIIVAEQEEIAKPDAGPVLATSSGSIHIELPGRALVSIEGSVDPALVRAVLMSLRS